MTWDRVLAATTAGIYESCYLKANSPDGRRALWLKHNLLRPLAGEARAELWAIGHERGKAPRVLKREVPWSGVTVSTDRPEIHADGVTLRADRAVGAIADARWSLALSGGLPPLRHLPHDWLYTAPFPKKKLLTPAPNLRFDGEIRWGETRWSVDGWVGLRGHNWGTEHAWTYAYGSCNAWDDGVDRAVDGFSAKVRLGRARSPWLSAVVGWAPQVRRNRIRHWLAPCEVSLARWAVRTGDVGLEMVADDPASVVGLRYAHPSGEESYCYNTKFAAVSYEVEGQRSTSRQGELEMLLPAPAPGIALHPAGGWTQRDDDYRSERLP